MSWRTQKRVSTIATHFGKMGSERHNRRLIKNEKHIDYNGFNKMLIDNGTVKQFYDRVLEQPYKEFYEKKQEEGHAKRYSPTAWDNAKTNNKSVAYELIVGVYPNDKTRFNINQDLEMYNDFFNSFQKKYKNLKIVNVSYHADEKGLPHCHCIYVPISENNERGAKIQNSMRGAIKEMGFKNNIDLTKSVNNLLESVAKKHHKDIEIIHPIREENKNKARNEKQRHKNTADYIAFQRKQSQNLKQESYINYQVAKKLKGEEQNLKSEVRQEVREEIRQEIKGDYIYKQRQLEEDLTLQKKITNQKNFELEKNKNELEIKQNENNQLKDFLSSIRVNGENALNLFKKQKENEKQKQEEERQLQRHIGGRGR